MTLSNIHVGQAGQQPQDASDFRYGIFIRPPVDVALVAARSMVVARDLFGFHAAASYAPHITLVGTIGLKGTESQLIAAIDGALAGRPPVQIHGSGLTAVGNAVAFDFQWTDDGQPNQELIELYESVRAATLPIRWHVPTDRNSERRQLTDNRESFRAHLTVVGHDGADNPDVRTETQAALEQFVTEMPQDWIAETVTLYRFWSSDWEGRYWLTQEWIPLRSWTLTGSRVTAEECR
jgi:2'-5' RNA ligase